MTHDEIKQICFSSYTLKNNIDKIYYHLPKKNNDGHPFYGTWNLPFKISYPHPSLTFKKNLNNNDPKKPDAVWMSIKGKVEYDEIMQWCRQREKIVFLKSEMDFCIALDFNFQEDKRTRTRLGQLECNTKERPCIESIDEIIHQMLYTMGLFEDFKNINYICAVTNKFKDFDLPTKLVQKICEKQPRLINVTDGISQKYCKESLKGASEKDKKGILERAVFSYNGQDIKGKDVILIDDKYQSGTTLHHFADLLKQSGANKIIGMCIVKTLRNTDNK